MSREDRKQQTLLANGIACRCERQAEGSAAMPRDAQGKWRPGRTNVTVQDAGFRDHCAGARRLKEEKRGKWKEEEGRGG